MPNIKRNKSLSDYSFLIYKIFLGELKSTVLIKNKNHGRLDPVLRRPAHRYHPAVSAPVAYLAVTYPERLD